MKTLLYNSATNKVISQVFDNGYLVDGKPQEVLPPIYELEYKPTIAPNISETQVKSAIWVPDIVLGTYTQVWEVRDKTEAELIAEKEVQALAKESEIDPIQIKKLLRITTESLPEKEQGNYYNVYPPWRPNVRVYDKTDSPTGLPDKVQHNNKLYKVITGHVTQVDWEPQSTPSLFVETSAPDVIPVWKQPTGAHDAYQTGDKVHFPTATDPVYESLIDANIWSPIDYTQGWKKL